MNEYTPTTEEVREGYCYMGIGPLDDWREDELLEKHGKEFDRWLAEHDRQVKAEAWAEGVKSECDYNWLCDEAQAAGLIMMFSRPKNPYLNGD